MEVVPQNSVPQKPASRTCCYARPNVVSLASAGSLIAGAILMLAGKRRAGLVAAAGGVTLAAVDQREVLRGWWNALPGYIEQTQKTLNQVQDAIHEVDVQRSRLQQIANR